jgi:hypothetical protein
MTPRTRPHLLPIAMLAIVGMAGCAGSSNSSPAVVHPAVANFAFAGVATDVAPPSDAGTYRDVLSWNWVGASAQLEIGTLDTNNQFVPHGNPQNLASGEGSGSFVGWEFQSPSMGFHTYRLTVAGTAAIPNSSQVIRQCVRVGNILKDPIPDRVLINGIPTMGSPIIPLALGQSLRIGFSPGSSSGCDEPVVLVSLTDLSTGLIVSGTDPWTVAPESDCTYQIAETRRGGGLTTFQVQVQIGVR